MKNASLVLGSIFVLLVGFSCSVPNPVAPVVTASSPTVYTVKYEVIESPTAHPSSLRVRFWSNNGFVGGCADYVNDSTGGDFYWMYTFNTTNTSFPIRLFVTNDGFDSKTFTGRIYINGVMKRERVTNGLSVCIGGEVSTVTTGELAGTVASLQ